MSVPLLPGAASRRRPTPRYPRCRRAAVHPLDGHELEGGTVIMWSKRFPWTARAAVLLAGLVALLATERPAFADESELELPNLASVQFFTGTDGRGTDGHTL